MAGFGSFGGNRSGKSNSGGVFGAKSTSRPSAADRSTSRPNGGSPGGVGSRGSGFGSSGGGFGGNRGISSRVPGSGGEAPSRGSGFGGTPSRGSGFGGDTSSRGSGFGGGTSSRGSGFGSTFTGEPAKRGSDLDSRSRSFGGSHSRGSGFGEGSQSTDRAQERAVSSHKSGPHFGDVLDRKSMSGVRSTEPTRAPEPPRAPAPGMRPWSGGPDHRGSIGGLDNPAVRNPSYYTYNDKPRYHLPVDIDDSLNYHPCTKKQYECWACKPPVGTLIVNRLFASPELVYVLGGKFCFTPDEVSSLTAANSPVISYLYRYMEIGEVYYVQFDDVVISGTRGELYTMKMTDFCSLFRHRSNDDWEYYWDRYISRVGKRDMSSSWTFPWTRVRYFPANHFGYVACFVPCPQTGIFRSDRQYAINNSGVDHGKGDFIVRRMDIYDRPDFLSAGELVNGLVFADTYDNHGWSNEIVSSLVKVLEPPKIGYFSSF